MDWIKPESNEQRIERVLLTYEQSLLSIGIDPRGKDLLEVIALLADKVNILASQVHNIHPEVHL